MAHSNAQAMLRAKREGVRKTQYFPGGDSYSGEFANDLRHGKGMLKPLGYPDHLLSSSVLTSTYFAGIFISKSHGTTYEGDWAFGKREGFGVVSFLSKVSEVNVLYQTECSVQSR